MTEISQVNANEHETLTEITKKSKAYWGYPEEQMNEWSDLLTVSSDYIVINQVYKLVVNDLTVAYYSYCNVDEQTVRLDNLFVLPENIGKGFGKLLMIDFLLKIKESKAKRIILDADPNAQKFYESFGFIKIGHVETSIKDRFLPVMELKL